jgi:transcriptional regulator with XRE-family HTH domain
MFHRVWTTEPGCANSYCMSEQRQPGKVPAFGLTHRLALALEVAELRPEDMAEEIGRSVTTIRNYLAGRTSPSRAVITAWAFRCGIDRDWLAYGISRPSPGDGGSVIGVSGSACTRSPQVTHLFGHRFDSIQPVDQCA